MRIVKVRAASETPAIQQPSLLLSLAAYLSAAEQQLTQKWIEAVLRNPEIPSAHNLTREQLVDHMPKLFQNLTSVLQQASLAGEPKNRLDSNAHIHGQHRWDQGYRLEELVRETQTTRTIVLLNGMSGFARANPQFTGEEKNRAKRILHRFFNEMVVASAQQFVDQQQKKITEMNRELQSANQQLTTVNQSRLKLTRTICHELSNILNALSAAVGVLDGETDEAVRGKMLRILHRNIQDMSSLLQQLLSYSVLLEGRRQSTIESFNPHWLFEELVATYEPLAQANGMTFKTRCDPALTQFVTYRLKIKQVASNLLSNAIKYGKRPDGDVSGHVFFSFEAAGGEHWKIVVEDKGVGIPSSETERIFEEFHRAPSVPENVHGTGLGLAITKALVELLCGRIEVHSSVGMGTRFEVILPKSIDSPCAQEQPDEEKLRASFPSD